MQSQAAPLLVCWGELLWDLFPSGACLGGAPSNVAMHLVANAQACALITRLGDDELGERARLQLQEVGMNVGGLQVDSELPTGRVGVEVVDGEAHYTLYPGAWRQIQCDAAARQLLMNCSAFYFGTLAQASEGGLQSWRQALQELPDSCLRICDPNLRGSHLDPELVAEHMRAADVVKINDDEATAMEREFRCKDIVRWLLEENNVTLVAKTHGPRGASLHTKTQTVHHPGFAFDRVANPGSDNVGAGDSFTAVLIRATLAQVSLEQAVRAANQYACFVASQRGATPSAPTELLRQTAEILQRGPG